MAVSRTRALDVIAALLCGSASLFGSTSVFAQSKAMLPAVTPETQVLPAAATPAPPPPVKAPAVNTLSAVDTCAARTDVLGVSRVVEIDTSKGPHFGGMHQSDLEFLEDGEVILTFDDGPMRRYTIPILNALDDQCTKATFFAVGRMALADPETLKETARRGHTIATHTWSHKNFGKINTAQSKTEIELGLSAVAHALGTTPAPFFRFPYLKDTKAANAYLGTRDLSAFSIAVDAKDFKTRNPAVVRKAVLDQLAVKHKGVILFHDIQPSTAGALATLLSDLKKRGFKVVHVVPKGTATTLPAFDAMAQKEANRRKVALVNQPLADRSVVWPVTPGSAAAPAAGKDGKPKVAVTPSSAPGAEVLPWQPVTETGSSPPPDNGAAAAPVTQPPPRQNRSWNPLDADPWTLRSFGD